VFAPFIRRLALAGCALSLCIGSTAEASPYLATYTGDFTVGPLAGTVFTANYVFDPLPPVGPGTFSCCADGAWSISSVLLNVGGREVMQQVNPGLAFLTNGAVGIFGPTWSVPAQFLPTGLLSWSFSGTPLFAYTFNDGTGGIGTSISGFTSITVTRLPRNIPEPASLILSVAALAAFAARRRLSRPASR